MRRRLRLLLVLGMIVGLAGLWLPAQADHNDDEHSDNMELLGTSEQSTAVNSDIAFWGNRAYSGTFNGFRIIDITDPTAIADPANVITDFSCPSSQNDISVWDNDDDPEADLLFLSVDGPRSNTTCVSSGVAAGDPTSWEGVRIFDINDETTPALIASVPTDCGSHTHTLIPGSDPFAANVYLYVSSYPLGVTAVTTALAARDDVVVDAETFDFPAGVRNDGTECLEPEPGEAKSNGYHNKISIIRVPLTDPAAADDRTPGPDGPGGDPTAWVYTNVIESGIEGGVEMTHRVSGGRVFDFTSCHDIAVFTGLNVPGHDTDRGIAAGACWKEGIFWDISNPESPDFLNSIENQEVNTLFHSATFTWDGKVVAFEDEAGGGGDDRCRDPEDLQGRMWFYSVRGQRQLGSFKIPRVQGKGQVCTAHNYNVLPVTDGRYILASAWYQGGTSMIDFTDPANAVELGYYDAHSPINGAGDPVDTDAWSSYWYNDYVYVNDISRGVDVISFDSPVTATAQSLPYLNAQVQESPIAQTYSVPSRVTLRYSGGAFKGRVLSDRAECQSARTVRIRKRRAGPDRTIETATTDAEGRFSANRSPLGPGVYYARVTRKSFGEGINIVDCLAATSNTIRRR